MPSTAPLKGLKIAEFARILAGPWAGQLLADLGAEVIKIEALGGDDTRGWGPPFIEGLETRDAAYFHAANRNKASVRLDFTSEADRRRAADIAAGADVVIENFKVGGLARFGLDYASLAAVNPRLVYCSITGFGQDGPYAAKPGYDFIVQGLSGIMDLTGEPGGAPQKMGVAYADIMTGLYATVAIQAALAERCRSGLGQHIDISLLDVMVGTLANQAMNYLVSGEIPRRMGNNHPNIAPYTVLPAADGWFILAVGNDAQYERFRTLVGLPDEPAFHTNSGRVAQRDRLVALAGAATRDWKRDDLIAALDAAGVPCGPINDVAQAFDDPQVRHRGLQLAMMGDDGTRIPGVRCPIRFSRSALAEPRPAPV